MHNLYIILVFAAVGCWLLADSKSLHALKHKQTGASLNREKRGYYGGGGGYGGSGSGGYGCGCGTCAPCNHSCGSYYGYSCSCGTCSPGNGRGSGGGYGGYGYGGYSY